MFPRKSQFSPMRVPQSTVSSYFLSKTILNTLNTSVFLILNLIVI
jgi:hypothetical protein